MDPYTLLQIAEASGVVLVGLGSAFFSRKAAIHSKPVSNGWTAGLGKRLDRQDEMLQKLDAKMDQTNRHLMEHLSDHIRRGQ